MLALGCKNKFSKLCRWYGTPAKTHKRHSTICLVVWKWNCWVWHITRGDKRVYVMMKFIMRIWWKYTFPDDTGMMNQTVSVYWRNTWKAKTKQIQKCIWPKVWNKRKIYLDINMIYKKASSGIIKKVYWSVAETKYWEEI